MTTDAALAADLVAAAGRILMEMRDRGALTGTALGDAADLAANGYLVDMLRRERPGDALLSEEECDTKARLAARRVWIIDPLDGTREYREGRDDWAVHVGLAVDGVAVDGAVALPALEQIFSSQKGGAAPSVPHLADKPARIVVSRTRPPPEAQLVAEAIGAQLVPMGSAGAKAMAVVRGDADIYLHSGGQCQWDSCAPVAVAHAAGLHVSRIDGAPMRYNAHDTLLPDVLICRPGLADRVLALINAAN